MRERSLLRNLLNTTPGSNVLDACAAPGGKTGHLLEHACINLTAVDQDRKRIDKVFDNLKRAWSKSQNSLHRSCELADQSALLLYSFRCALLSYRNYAPTSDIMLLRDKSDIDKLFEIQNTLGEGIQLAT